MQARNHHQVLGVSGSEQGPLLIADAKAAANNEGQNKFWMLQRLRRSFQPIMKSSAGSMEGWRHLFLFGKRSAPALVLPHPQAIIEIKQSLARRDPISAGLTLRQGHRLAQAVIDKFKGYIINLVLIR